MKCLKKLEDEISRWPGVAVHPHQFEAREFRFRNAEVGHLHEGGTLDIPFTRSIRDALLAEGLAEEHRWVPNSGWITFHVRTEKDIKHAMWLLRLSYLRYTLKTDADPIAMLKHESEQMHLSQHLESLLELFVPVVKNLHG